jgi:hypothetical protein
MDTRNFSHHWRPFVIDFFIIKTKSYPDFDILANGKLFARAAI